MPRTKQYAKRVNIKKYVKVGSRWRFAPIVRKKGKMVQDHVYIAGRDEHHPEGAYSLEWLEFGRRRRKSVSDYNELDEAARLKAIEVEAMKAGLIAPPAEPPRPVVNLKILSTAVDHYLSMVEAQRSPK